MESERKKRMLQQRNKVRNAMGKQRTEKNLIKIEIITL